MKIIFDTNIWISHFLCKSFPELTKILVEDKEEIVFSLALLTELKAVLVRPKFKSLLTIEQINEIEQLLLIRATFYHDMDVKTERNSRDSKDNFLLSLSIESNSDYLVTGDEDLLVLGQIDKTRILKWKDFINIYN